MTWLTNFGDKARAVDTSDSSAAAVAANPEDRRPGQASKSFPAQVVAGTPAQQTASLTASAEPVARPALSAVEINKSVQTELHRVGCYDGSADGNWGKASRLSLEKFNRYAGVKLNVRLASLDTLGVIKAKAARVCPLICRHGYKADGEACVKIACGDGKVLNDDNKCVARKERRTPSASRERGESRPLAPRRLPSRARARPEQGGIVCDDRTAVRYGAAAGSSSVPPRRAAASSVVAAMSRSATDQARVAVRSRLPRY